MSPADAAKLLDLPVDATPEQLEARFLGLRTKLEDKIAKAPTPGLKAKYRESLEEITTAFETLTLAADSSSLPVAQKQGAGSKEQGVPNVGPPPRDELGALSQSKRLAGVPSPGNPKSKIQNQKSGKEFAVVALIALALLGAGGWFIMKTRAGNEEKARFAAEQKAEAERVAADQRHVEESRKNTQEGKLIELRARHAELNVGFEAAFRSEQQIEKKLAAFRSELSDLQRDNPGDPVVDGYILEAKIRALEVQLKTVRRLLPAHPARAARAKATAAIQAREVAAAGGALEEFATLLAALNRELEAAAPDLRRVEADTGRAATLLARWRLAARQDEIARHVAARFSADPAGIPSDEAAAIDWLLAAANQGDVKALYLVGVARHAGRIKGDSVLGRATADQLISDAARAGCAEASLWMGRELKMPFLALPYLKAAAEAGLADGQYELGVMLLEGPTVTPDPAAAARWFERAATQGHAAAQFRLGLSHAQGSGVAQNQDLAFDWIRKAARQGDENARTHLRNLGRNW